MEEHDRYTDPGLAAQSNPGEISPEALDALHAMITEKLADREAFARWFGGYNSTPKYPEVDWSPEETFDEGDVRELLASGATLVRNPASRFSFVRQDEGVMLFVDGECFECTGEVADFAETLCASDSVSLHPDLIEAQELIVGLLNQGSLAVDDD